MLLMIAVMNKSWRLRRQSTTTIYMSPPMPQLPHEAIKPYVIVRWSFVAIFIGLAGEMYDRRRTKNPPLQKLMALAAGISSNHKTYFNFAFLPLSTTILELDSSEYGIPPTLRKFALHLTLRRLY